MAFIPIIDLSSINGPLASVNNENMDKVAVELEKALIHGIGFAYLVNHGIDKKKIESIYEVSREFFELPGEVKRKYRKPAPKKSFHGYSAPGDELLNEHEKNSTELKEFFDVWGPQAKDDSTYPMEEVPALKHVFEDVRCELNNLALKMLKCYAKFLKLEDEDFFVKRHRNLVDDTIKTQTQLRSKYYYILGEDADIPDNAIRCGEHSDWGSITLLFQDMVGGLEVKTSAGEWVEATPIPDSILINNGQLMELWTAGRIFAAPHRVRIVTEGVPAMKPRQSFIHFVNPDGHEKVSPVVPILPGKEEFGERPTLVAFDHYQRLIENAAVY